MTQLAPPIAEVGNEARSGLTEAERHHINLQSIFFAADAVVKIFLALYLFDMGGVHTVAVFYCVRYVAMTIGFVIVGKLLRRYSTRTMMRVGLACLIAVYALLVMVDASAKQWVLVIGLLSGLGEGLYWPGINVVQYIVTHDTTRSLYNGRLVFMNNVASTIAPPLAGGLFEITSQWAGKTTAYYALFLVLVGLMSWTWMHAGSSGAWHGAEYSTRASWRLPGREWTMVLGEQFVSGLWKTAMTMLAPILVLTILRREMDVSVYSALTTVACAACAVVAGRMLHRWRDTYVIGVVSVPVGMILFAVDQSWLGLAAYMLCVNALDGFTYNASCRVSFKALDRTGLSWRHTYHLVVELEAALNAGRITGFAVVLALLFFQNDIQAVCNGMVLLAPFAVVSGLFQAWLERHQSETALVAPLH